MFKPYNPANSTPSYDYNLPISQQKKYFLSLKTHPNDFSNHSIHDNESNPTSHIPNIDSSVQGYPRLNKLLMKKALHNSHYFTKPLGYRTSIEMIVPTLNNWIQNHNLIFDTIMIGSLTENQFLLPILNQIPLDKLIMKPGFLFIWGSSHKLNELNNLIQNNNANNWSEHFRRSEELVFLTNDDNTPYKITSNDQSLMTRKQWHCSMCITGTVKRDADGHIVHCNVNPDLKIEDDFERQNPTSVPDSIYKVAENFSSGNRRLHIIPSRSGLNTPVKLRNGWVIISPDVLLNNFDPEEYKRDIEILGHNIPQNNEIEELRPKSPEWKKRY